jgi:hypothetical protein
MSSINPNNLSINIAEPKIDNQSEQIEDIQELDIVEQNNMYCIESSDTKNYIKKCDCCIDDISFPSYEDLCLQSFTIFDKKLYEYIKILYLYKTNDRIINIICQEICQKFGIESLEFANTILKTILNNKK